MSWLSRLRLLSLLPASLVAVAAADAEAETAASLPNGAVVQFVDGDELLVQDDDDEALEPPKTEDEDRFFNFAHCVCSERDDFRAREFGFKIDVEGDVGETVSGQIWIGNTGAACN
jgi:hypothetical protein